MIKKHCLKYQPVLFYFPEICYISHMTSSEIRSKFLAFFEKRGHVVIPSASLVTPDEKGVTNSTLFNTAGMQPLIPFLLGKPHPMGTRLVDSQKCVRTIDIDEIGDNTHATFFEMLGNWSLGDYFKEDAIRWSYEFLTDSKEGLGLNPQRLYVTVFEGNTDAVKDTESAQVWEKVGVPKHRIYFKDAASNWWPAVKPGKDNTWTGPTGPCSEMFYDITEKGLGDLSPEEFEKADSDQKVVEIWNDVFMEFEKKDGIIVGKLEKKNVDTGAGLERLLAVIQKVDNIFDTDILKSIMDVTQTLSQDLKKQRIIADHMRASVFLIADGVVPSNTDRGYILRKLIRRAVFACEKNHLLKEEIIKLVNVISKVYKGVYINLEDKKELIINEIDKEVIKFDEAKANGLKELVKITDKNISAEDAFKLFSSYGFPIELTVDHAKSRNQTVDLEGFNELVKKHQELSRSGAEQKFKGGLADANDPQVVKYHTATHLLHQALHDVLGDGVGQKGSNITAERLRFDFSYDKKMTDEEKKKVEEIVNEKIKAAMPVNQVTMPRAEAEKTGARHFFGEKYGEEISIYFIGNDLQSAYSKEFCGGPHVKNTSELGTFKIQKEEASSQGVRRIKAVLV